MFDILLQPENLIFIAIVVGVMATVVTVILPMLSGNSLNSRMKSVALERDQIRARERARMASEKKERTKAVKKEPGAVIKSLVEKLNLRTALADEETTKSLIMAGYRGQSPLFLFLAMRFILPFIFMAGGAVYLFFIHENDYSTMQRMIGSFFAGALGFYLPVAVVKNRVSARQLSITRAWPDALDLCLICVVQERRQAYENLTERTGLESVKNVVLSLIQAEKYGTPLSSALRVLSQENRDQRMAMAEKKAASLPPKLTVPMMVCFLPVLFCVILGPAIITALAAFE